MQLPTSTVACAKLITLSLSSSRGTCSTPLKYAMTEEASMTVHMATRLAKRIDAWDIPPKANAKYQLIAIETLTVVLITMFVLLLRQMERAAILEISAKEHHHVHLPASPPKQAHASPIFRLLQDQVKHTSIIIAEIIIFFIAIFAW